MNDIIELKLDEVGIAYKMYAPNRSTNLIERIVDKTKKPYEYEMLVEIKEELERVNKDKSGVILDVGLNIGNHALFFAALGYKVIGIEANPKMVAIAQKSVQINGFEDKIKIITMGASDKNESLEFETEIPHNYGMMHLGAINQMGGQRHNRRLQAHR